MKRLTGLTAVLVAGAWMAPATAAPMSCDTVSAEALGVGDAITITEAVATPAGADSPVDHCLVRGATPERTGQDGRSYAIKFELRLPDEWNGSFVYQFNGGSDGAVVPAMGAPLGGDQSLNALSRGYAVLSSDSGHDGSAVTDAGLAGGMRFGFDQQARSDYGYNAEAVLAPIAQQVIAAYYDAAIEQSYAVGCSNGGRHAMIAAARMPDTFDGILAGAPGFNLPKAAIQHAWDVQSFKPITGDVRTAFSQADLALVADAVVAQCDGLDGLEDGIVGDTKACQATFSIDALACAAGATNQCLPQAQIDALKTIHGGPKNSAGEQLYSEWAWDRGIASGDWRFWKIESPVPPWEQMPLIAVMGAGSLAQIFTTPPTEVGGSPAELEQFLLEFDFDEDAPKIYATTPEFPESPMDFMTPPGADNPDLAAFRDAGGKLVVYHGVSDPVFSYLDTAAWYDRLDANNGDNAEEFARLFPVPGMPHCSGGPSVGSFDAFSALVDWVEEDQAPDQLIAGVVPGNPEMPAEWSAERTRPLCPYPLVARYTGDDPEAAASFTCER